MCQMLNWSSRDFHVCFDVNHKTEVVGLGWVKSSWVKSGLIESVWTRLCWVGLDWEYM